jgi:LPS-assembly lipoprotein
MKLLPLMVVLPLALASSACGFRPLYASNGTSGGTMGTFSTIYVDSDDTEIVGYELRNALIDALQATNDPRAARYKLHYTLRQAREGVTIAPDAAITRYDYNLIVKYSLLDAKTGNAVTSGTESTLTAFDVVSSPYSTLVAQQSAQKTASQDVATRIQIDLAVYFDKHPQR